LLRIVDRQVDHELIGRFDSLSASDPNVVAIRRMTEDVVDTSQELAARQAEIWQATIDAAHQQWSSLVETAGGQIEDSIAAAIKDSLSELRKEIANTGTAVSDQASTQWEKWQQSFRESATLLKEQQAEMTKQGAVMTRALEATGDVIKLENALNQNLRTLAGAKHFEETVMSLSAAIHLLNSRLGAVNQLAAVDLKQADSEKKAAEDSDNEDKAA